MVAIVGCEESQAVTIALRKKGIEAYSNDLLPCSGGFPKWHLQMDVFEAIELKKPMLGIFFPPCTRLTITANKWYKPEFRSRFPNILEEREEAVKFFMRIANCDIARIAIENPVGIMSTRWRKPNQIFHPYHFGDKAVKRTCLWLKNLPPLSHTKIVVPEYLIYNSKSNPSGKSRYPSLWLTSGLKNFSERSKTYPGIAEAMATQWVEFIHCQDNQTATT